MPRERVGIIGWNYPEWKGTVYAPGTKPADFLREYAKLFSIVEVASSFYRAPDAETVAGWAEATPKGFELSLKVPDWIVKKPADPAVPGHVQARQARVRPASARRRAAEGPAVGRRAAARVVVARGHVPHAIRLRGRAGLVLRRVGPHAARRHERRAVPAPLPRPR